MKCERSNFPEIHLNNKNGTLLVEISMVINIYISFVGVRVVCICYLLIF